MSREGNVNLAEARRAVRIERKRSGSRPQLDWLGASLAAASPSGVLRAAVERFPRVTFATGFGLEGCVLIDIIARDRLPIDVFTLDTGLLFAETYELWRRLEERYGLAIRGVRPPRTVAEQAAEFGDRLWERNPNRCCHMRKVLPLRTALSGFDAWVTAIRRDQTRERSGVAVIEWDDQFALVKINPLAHWDRSTVWTYVRRNQVPFNPLHDRGYPSIGCVPCTSAVAPGEDPRAGRWRGSDRKECGIHTRSVERPAVWNRENEEIPGDARIG
jgi:thioredoxin-dependent adenylylsulfate APS reductase